MKPQDAYLATQTFPGLGVRRALALWRNNIKNSAELGFMTDKEILELAGIDQTGLREIRLIYPAITWTRALENKHKAILEEVSATDADEAKAKE